MEGKTLSVTITEPLLQLLVTIQSPVTVLYPPQRLLLKGENPLSDVGAGAGLLCACTNLAQRISLTNVLASEEERGNWLQSSS